MARNNGALTAAVVALGACGAIGGYGSMWTGSRNGLFDVIGKRALDGLKSDPHKHRLTGVQHLDGVLANLVNFFEIVMSGERTWDLQLSIWFLAAQFFAGWCLVSIEGIRQGNQGRLASRTNIAGQLMQFVSFTVAGPMYFIVHLLTSPVKTGKPEALAIRSNDANALFISALLGFGIPSILMILPTPGLISDVNHYMWVAIWQVFPLVQSVFQWVLKHTLFRTSSSPRASRGPLAISSLYQFVMAICVVSHTGLMAIALTPETAVPSGWAPWWSALLREVTVDSAFVPTSLLNPPSLVSSNSLVPLVMHFLRWDVYTGGVAILVWASYLYSASGAKKSVFAKAVFWFLLGDSPAAAAFLLWTRDEALLGREAEKAKKIR